MQQPRQRDPVITPATLQGIDPRHLPIEEESRPAAAAAAVHTCGRWSTVHSRNHTDSSGAGTCAAP